MFKICSQTFKVILVLLLTSYLYPLISQSNNDTITESEHYQEVFKHLENGQEKEARNSFYESLALYEEEENWEAYIDLVFEFLVFKRETKFYEEPIITALEVVTYLKDNKPEVYLNCGKIYRWMGNTYALNNEKEKSLEACKIYYDITNRKYPNEDCLESAIANNVLGIGSRTAGVYDKAQYHFKKAIVILEELDKSKSVIEELAKSYEHLGHFYYMFGQTERSVITTIKGYEYAVQVVGQNDLFLVPFLVNIAGFYAELGEYELSLEYNKRALYIIEESGTRDYYYFEYVLPKIYIDIANELQLNKKYDEAIDRYNKALEIIKVYRQDWIWENNVFKGIAAAYLSSGENKKALSYYSKADSTLEAASQNVKESNSYKIEQAHLKLHQSELYLNINEQERAKQNLNLAEKIASFIGEDLNGLKPIIYYHRSGIYQSELEFDSSLYYNQIAMYASAGDCSSSDTIYIPKVKDFESTSLTYSIINQRISLLKQLADSKSQINEKQHYLNRAFTFLELIDSVHLSSLKKISKLRNSKSKSLIEASIECYKNGLDAIYSLYKIDPTDRHLEKAFEVIQRAKAQALLLNQLNENASSKAQLPNDVLEEERNLNLEILQLEKQVLDAQDINDSLTVKYIENELLFLKKRELAFFKKKIENDYPDYYANKYNFTSTSINDLKNSIKEDEVIIDYTFTSDSTFFIYAIDKNSTPVFLKKTCATNLSVPIKKYFKFIQRTTLVRHKNLNSFVNQSSTLYNIFIEPIEEKLLNKNRIIIFGDNLSYYIPFETLIENNEVKEYHELPFLIKQFDISYHYSSSIFYESRSKNYDLINTILAFAPVYDNAIKKENDEGISFIDNMRMDTTLRAFNTDGSYLPLFESENEVVAISNMFDQEMGSNLLLREEASEAQLKAYLKKPFKYIHIAGHSFANLKHPQFSGIACYQEDEENNEDGILYLGELTNIPIKADLVTLSSCESGFGQLDYSEGMLGINRNIIQSGANNVVYTLWKVMDGVSANLMINFYKKITEGQNYARALRSAKLELLAQKETATPNLWSAFLLIGR